MSDLHHLAAAYALNALDNDERRAFEAHYPTCDICAQEVADFRTVASALAETTATAPPVRLKANVMAEIAGTRQLSPLTTTQPTPAPAKSSPWLMAAAAALLVLGGIAAFTLRNVGSDADPVIEVVEAVDAVMTPLDPTAANPLGRVQVVWSGERDQVVVVGQQLGQIAPGQAYALWFLYEDETVELAGLFQPDDGFYSDVLDVADRMPSGWGISIEPVVGSTQPTTPVLFASNI